MAYGSCFLIYFFAPKINCAYFICEPLPFSLIPRKNLDTDKFRIWQLHQALKLLKVTCGYLHNVCISAHLQCFPCPCVQEKHLILESVRAMHNHKCVACKGRMHGRMKGKDSERQLHHDEKEGPQEYEWKTLAKDHVLQLRTCHGSCLLALKGPWDIHIGWVTQSGLQPQPPFSTLLKLNYSPLAVNILCRFLQKSWVYKARKVVSQELWTPESLQLWSSHIVTEWPGWTAHWQQHSCEWHWWSLAREVHERG